MVSQSAAPEEVQVGPGVERMQCYTGNCTTAAACRQLSLVQDCPDGGEHDACVTTIEQKGDMTTLLLGYSLSLLWVVLPIMTTEVLLCPMGCRPCFYDLSSDIDFRDRTLALTARRELQSQNVKAVFELSKLPKRVSDINIAALDIIVCSARAFDYREAVRGSRGM